MYTLTKSNCKASQAKSGNIYITHPSMKSNVRLYATIEELKADEDWRKKVYLVEGEFGIYARLAKTEMEDLDV